MGHPGTASTANAVRVRWECTVRPLARDDRVPCRLGCSELARSPGATCEMQPQAGRTRGRAQHPVYGVGTVPELLPRAPAVSDAAPCGLVFEELPVSLGVMFLGSFQGGVLTFPQILKGLHHPADLLRSPHGWPNSPACVCPSQLRTRGVWAVGRNSHFSERWVEWPFQTVQAARSCSKAHVDLKLTNNFFIEKNQIQSGQKNTYSLTLCKEVRIYCLSRMARQKNYLSPFPVGPKNTHQRCLRRGTLRVTALTSPPKYLVFILIFPSRSYIDRLRKQRTSFYLEHCF